MKRSVIRRRYEGSVASPCTDVQPWQGSDCDTGLVGVIGIAELILTESRICVVVAVGASSWMTMLGHLLKHCEVTYLGSGADRRLEASRACD
jgi:hypothetical protein